MKLTEVIKKRYSCRSYSDRKVSNRLILELLELANWAPSAGNQQNREFIVIKKRQDRKWLAQMNNQRHLGEAPVVVLVTSGVNKKTINEYLEGLKEWEMTVGGKKPDEFKITDKFKKEFQEMKYKWMISDAAAAVQNLLLAAAERGLATCWIGIMDFEKVSQKFKLPLGVIPVCLITLGYEKFTPRIRRQRKEIKKLVHWDCY